MYRFLSVLADLGGGGSPRPWVVQFQVEIFTFYFLWKSHPLTHRHHLHKLYHMNSVSGSCTPGRSKGYEFYLSTLGGEQGELIIYLWLYFISKAPKETHYWFTTLVSALFDFLVLRMFLSYVNCYAFTRLIYSACQCFGKRDFQNILSTPLLEVWPLFLKTNKHYNSQNSVGRISLRYVGRNGPSQVPE